MQKQKRTILLRMFKAWHLCKAEAEKVADTPRPHRVTGPNEAPITSSQSTKVSFCQDNSPLIDPVLLHGDALSPTNMVDTTRTESRLESEVINRMSLEDCTSSPATSQPTQPSYAEQSYENQSFPGADALGIEAEDRGAEEGAEEVGEQDMVFGNDGIPPYADISMPAKINVCEVGMCESGMIALQREMEQLKEAMSELQVEFDASVAFRERLREERDELHKELTAQVALNANYREDLSQCHQQMAEMEQNLGEFHVQAGFQRTHVKLLEEQLEMADERLRDMGRSENANNQLITNSHLKSLLIRLESIQKKANRKAAQTQEHVDALHETIRERDGEIEALRLKLALSKKGSLPQDTHKTHIPPTTGHHHAGASLRSHSSSLTTGSGIHNNNHNNNNNLMSGSTTTTTCGSSLTGDNPLLCVDGVSTVSGTITHATTADATPIYQNYPHHTTHHTVHNNGKTSSSTNSNGRGYSRWGHESRRETNGGRGCGSVSGATDTDTSDEPIEDTNGKEEDELFAPEAWNKLRESGEERKKERGTGGTNRTREVSGDGRGGRNANGVDTEAHVERGQPAKKSVGAFKKRSIAARMEEEQYVPKVASSEKSYATTSATTAHTASADRVRERVREDSVDFNADFNSVILSQSPTEALNATRAAQSAEQASSWIEGFAITHAISKIERKFRSMVRELRE